jgi:hypothetical protein
MATATVYGLCASGQLPHIRILNAIRLEPRELDAFVASRRHGDSASLGEMSR